MRTAPAGKSIARRLWDLALPIIGLNMLSVLTLAVDTAMCGRLSNAEAVLEGLGFAVQLVFLAMVGMIGLTVGTVALVARSYGAGKHARVNHLLAQSTQLTVFVGIAVAVVGNAFAEPAIRGLGASGESVTEALHYLRPALAGTLFYYLNILYAGVLRGVGNTRLPFLIALGTNLLNIALNYGLILGNLGLPELGVQGAALGTIISYAGGTLAYIILLRHNAVPKITIPLRPQKIDGRLTAELYRVGWPAALDMIMLNAAFLSVVGILGRLDATAVAAHGIGLRIQALAFVPGLAISQATGALVGQALGANKIQDARGTARAAVVLCVAVMSSLAIALVVFAYPIVSIFDVAPGTELAHYSVLWIRILGCGMPIVGVSIALIGLLQGAGATSTSLWINFIGTIAVQIPLAIILVYVFDLGAAGAWGSFPLSFLAKSGMNIVAYRRGKWATTGVHV